VGDIVTNETEEAILFQTPHSAVMWGEVQGEM